MYLIFLYLILAKHTPAPPAYPFPPANPCSNPVKCDRYRPMMRPAIRQPRGTRR